jgi:uncharacterized protein YqhQ
MKDEEIIVGGQAVIEGVMMRAPHSYAVAVRKPNGEIVVRAEKLPVLAEKYPLLKLPILRGAAVLIHSMMLGIKSLNFSANVVFHDALTESDSTDSGKVEVATVGSATLTTGTMTVAAHAAPLTSAPATATEAPAKAKPAKAKQKAAKAKSTSSAAAIGSIIFALFFNVILFIVLPLLITNALFVYFGGGTIDAHSSSGTWYADAWAWIRAALHPIRPSVAFNLVDGTIRMLFFLIMITTFSLLRDIRRVFEYHGAEHKVVYTWEAAEELTVENARQKRRQHPRCGTSFLMVVMLVSIVAFSIIKFDSLFLNFLTRIALIPVIAGASYEIIRASAKSGAQLVFSIITRPGLWLQNITTREPDDKQLEVAIVALKESLKLEPAGA